MTVTCTQHLHSHHPEWYYVYSAPRGHLYLFIYAGRCLLVLLLSPVPFHANSEVRAGFSFISSPSQMHVETSLKRVSRGILLYPLVVLEVSCWYIDSRRIATARAKSSARVK